MAITVMASTQVNVVPNAPAAAAGDAACASWRVRMTVKAAVPIDPPTRCRTFSCGVASAILLEERPVGGGHGGHQGQADPGAAEHHGQAEQHVGGAGAEEGERDRGGGIAPIYSRDGPARRVAQPVTGITAASASR